MYGKQTVPSTNSFSMQEERSSRSVFVGNIPYEATEEQLREIFNQAGPVVSFRLVFDRESGKPKGYGFCEYQDTETAQSAMRNLNNHDFNGRPLRVGFACGEQGKDDNKMQQALGGPAMESPYGESVEPEKAPEAISKAVASLPPEQMFELMKQMKMCIQNNPNEARNMLLQNPQLAYALLQAQIIMKIVDPQVALAMLHRPADQVPSMMPGNQQQHASSAAETHPGTSGGPQFQQRAPTLNTQAPGNSAPAMGTMAGRDMNNMPLDRRDMSGPRPPAGYPNEGMPRGPAPGGFMGDASPRVPGFMGETGPRGSMGPGGFMSEGGQRGPPGPGGYMGDAGPRGPPGPGGYMGDTGPKGYPGPGGYMGDAGPRGPPGPAGYMGEAGPRGPRGPGGLMGDVGPRAPGGLMGEARPRGPGAPSGGFMNEPGARGHGGFANEPVSRGSSGIMRDPRSAEMRSAAASAVSSQSPHQMVGMSPRSDSSGLTPRSSVPTDIPHHAGPPMRDMRAPGPRAARLPTSVASSSSGPQLSHQDQEKAALIMQVLQLTDEQIAMLPADQRHSILILKDQIARSAAQP